ncbi:MAG TPA: adenosylcobalamin-dependent ribonucleoside-diphosphate reductase [Thermoanaerobaculia bacterium]|nr:adenosylcobalamin-dependent ribonucleoside-diphosphate reductase [Thermoanaerobaculia bacterium]
MTMLADLPATTSNASRVLEARYLRRDADRKIIETPQQLYERVARAVSQGELLSGNARQARRYEDDFLGLILSGKFLPNSPTLMNAGTPLGQLSACFVLPVHDSMEDIFEAIRRMALIQQSGGGTGFSFSELRPQGDIVRSTSGEASGPLSFMRIFDSATENIRQGGKRRGANMGVLRVDHPDILDFVRAKVGGDSALRNFNLSVAVTDDFMRAARTGERIALINPRNGATMRSIDAAEILDAMVDATWSCGDPGVLFLDAINAANPTPSLGRIEATNPCGEVPLLPYEACNLGSIDLAKMTIQRNGTLQLDALELRRVVRLAVRFLDDVIDVNRYTSRETEAITRANRKIGLGVMGFAALLIRLGISYDSDDAVHLASHIARFIEQNTIAASQELAEERGVFPNWNASIYAKSGLALRNATRTAIAPTGTLSILAQTTPSIEPLFALAYRRTGVLGGQTLTEISPLLLDFVERNGLRFDAAQIIARGTIAQTEVSPDVKALFATALEIPIERHLQIQHAFQRFIDNSVSKTINLPADAKRENVEHGIWRAWELGLKGVTFFRFGSRGNQVIELGAGETPVRFEQGSKCDPAECAV